MRAARLLIMGARSNTRGGRKIEHGHTVCIPQRSTLTYVQSRVVVFLSRLLVLVVVLVTL